MTLFANRNIIYALSIIGVYIYHTALIGEGLYLGRLNIGYVGVDAFMLFSGYGIAKSLSHNSLRIFYRNRAIRIIPIWVLFMISAFTINIAGGMQLGWEILVKNITTLSFYTEPDNLCDWYLSTLMLFYLLSPAFKVLIEKSGWLFVAGVYIFVLLYSELVDFNIWQYSCAVERLPLYLLGMTCYINKKPKLPISLTFSLFVLSFFFFYQEQHYLFSSAFVLLPIQIFNLIISKFNCKNLGVLEKIGKQTLELYVGNILAGEILHYWFNDNGYLSLLIYILISLGFAFFYIMTHRCLCSSF